jgi:isoleucyl-tRNA synthetase
VLTHGFTLDEKGMKMSKSLGNTVAPAEVIKEYGADILRLWVAQSDYTADLRIGPEILKGTADSYRRLRNTLRFVLGNLDGFHRCRAVARGHAGTGTMGAAPAGAAGSPGAQGL